MNMDPPDESIQRSYPAYEFNSRTPSQRARFFLEILYKKDLVYAKTILKHVYYLVDIQAIPCPVYSVLICVILKLYPSFNLIERITSLKNHVLLQKSVVFIFTRSLRKINWRNSLEVAGGLDALSQLCIALSPNNLYVLVKEINYHFAKPWIRTSETEELMQELLLNCIQYDKRALQKCYAKLVPSCGDDFIRNLETYTGGTSLNNHVDIGLLIYSHTSLYREVVLSEIETIIGYKEAFMYLFQHLHRDSLHQPGFTPHNPTNFAFEVLTKILEGHSFDTVELCPISGQHWIGSLIKCVFSPVPSESSTNELFRRLDIVATARKQCPALFPDDYNWRRLPLSAVTTLWVREYLNKSSKFNKVDRILQEIYSSVGQKDLSDVKKFLETQNKQPKSMTNTVVRPTRKKPEPSNFPCIVELSPVKARYPLLRRLIQILHPAGLDVDNAEDVALIANLVDWNVNFFIQLEPSKAAQLWRRFMTAPSISHSRYDHPVFDPLNPRDYHLEYLLLYLEPPNYERAKELVRSYQFKAERESLAVNRALWIIEAFRCAVGSKSQQIYSENLIWSRRFLKDPIAFEDLLTDRFLTATETRDLFVGFDENDSKKMMQKNYEASIGQEILLNHATMLLDAKREPSFVNEDGNSIRLNPTTLLTLVSEVVLRRVYLVCRYRTNPNFDKLVSTILDPSFDFLVQVEKMFLDPSYNILTFGSESGILTGVNGNDNSNYIKNAPSSIRGLLDKYIENRDNIWTTYRAQMHFEDETLFNLPEQYPRGLPIQKLLPPAIGIKTLENMPYLRSRVAKVLELPSLHHDVADTLRPCELDEDKIWTDSYSYAAKLHFLDLSSEQRNDVAWKMWESCKTRQLYGRPLDEHEQKEWIKKFGSMVGENLSPPESSKPFMSILEVDNGLEWAPLIRTAQDQSRLKSDHIFEDTVLLDMLQTTPQSLTPQNESSDRILNSRDNDIWPDMYELPQDENVRNAYILSSLLCLDSETGRKDSFLNKPFPSPENQRLPSVFIDTDFLMKWRASSRSKKSNKPNEVVKALIKEFPPSLLVKLLERYRKSDSDQIHDPITLSYFIKICRNLMQSNNPELAVPIIRDLFLNQPESSSWVRVIATGKFLKSLSADRAMGFLNDLGDEILSRLEKQQRRHGTENPTTESDSEYPVIKITTLKHLPQIVSQAGFLPYNESLNFLSKIFKVSQHRDVLWHTAQTVLEIAKRLGESAKVAIDTLRLLIPRVAGPHERSYSSGDMLETTENENIPSTYSLSERFSSADHRLFRLLFIDAADYISKYMRGQYVETILLPIVNRSIKEHGLWLQKLIALVGNPEYTRLAKDVASHLPMTPFYPEMTDYLIEIWGEHVPYDHIRIHSDRDLTYTCYSHFDTIDELVEGLTDPQLDQARSHWKGLRELQKSSRETLSLLRSILKSGGTEQIKSSIYSLAIDKAKFHLNQGSCSRVSALMERFELIWKEQAESSFPIETSVCLLSEGDSQARSIWRELVDMVQERRTPEWQRNLQRKPARLPQTFFSELALLNWPSPTDELDLRLYSKFVMSIRNLLLSVLRVQPTYHREMNILQRRFDAWRKRVSMNKRMAMALALGDVGVPASGDPINIIFIQISNRLFRSIKNPSEVLSKADRDQFVALVKNWRESSVEQARITAFLAEKRIREATPAIEKKYDEPSESSESSDSEDSDWESDSS